MPPLPGPEGAPAGVRVETATPAILFRNLFFCKRSPPFLAQGSDPGRVTFSLIEMNSLVL